MVMVNSSSCWEIKGHEHSLISQLGTLFSISVITLYYILGYKFKNNPDITKQKKEKELAFELYCDDKSKRVYQVSQMAHSFVKKLTLKGT